MQSQLCVLGISAVAGVVTTYLARRFALRFQIVNHPNTIIPQHKMAVAYLGGVGIALGVVVALSVVTGLGLAPAQYDRATLPFVTGGLLFLVLGVFDDLKAFAPLPKFALQVLAATIAVALGLQYPFTGMGLVDGILSGFWLLVMVNALNLTDVCDGLAGGLAAISLLFFALLGVGNIWLALVLTGATLGFLLWNVPPARIYLGDAGSHLLGFALAGYALVGLNTGVLWTSLPMMMLVLGVPLFELVFLMAIRRRKGLLWWKGSSDHFSLRLQAAGWGKWGADVAGWGSALLLCGVSWLLPHIHLLGRMTLLFGVLIWLVLCWRLLLKWEVKPSG